MAATIPLWAIGKNITALTLTPLSLNTATGVLTATTPVQQFFGHCKSIQLEVDITQENISSMDRPYANMVPIEISHTLKITEHEKSAGSNLAAAAAFTFSLFQYILTRGGQSFTGYARLQGYSMDANKPNVDGVLTLVTIDTGDTTPSLVYG